MSGIPNNNVTTMTFADTADVEPVTEADIAQADADADAAEQAVTDLERRVVEGDESVTAEQIEKQRGESRFARLRAAMVARKRARAVEAERLRKADALRAEIEAHSTEFGAHLAGLMLVAEQHLTEFFVLCRQRDAKVRDWRLRAAELNLGRHMGTFAPGEENARLGMNERELYAGDRVIDMAELDTRGQAEQAVRRALDNAREGRGVAVETSEGREAYAALAAIDTRTLKPPAEDVKFYLSEGGAVLQYAEEPPEDVRARVTPLSRKEAERIVREQTLSTRMTAK
ncbi:hypothetical protein ACVDFE_07840 [Lentzea chajnantorensis]